MLKKKLFRAARLTEDRCRQVLRLNESEAKLSKDAQSFWSRPIDAGNSFWWHARGSTPFANADEKWQAMGDRHVAMFKEFARGVGIEGPVDRIVDWGCGGGANATAFAPHCKEMWGVDVSADALSECERQVKAASTTCRFHSLPIEVARPEAALDVIPRDVDLFHSFYVFEVFPSQAYGTRILKIAYEMLRPGGLAIIQVKYATDSWHTRSRRWGYRRGVAHMTSYRVEEFWAATESVGFTPKAVVLVPQPQEVPDVRYAYYLLQKPVGR